MAEMIQRIAMKAVIAKDGKILILREAATYGDGTNRGRYHLPGGRVEVGEPFEEALLREIKEETGLKVEVDRPFAVGEWRPVIRGVPNQIIGVFWLCKPKTNKVKLSTEHDEFLWIDPKDRHKYDLMASEDNVIDRYSELFDGKKLS